MAVKEAPLRVAPEAGEIEIAGAHKFGKGAVGPDRIRKLERGEPGVRARDIEAEQGRRGVAGAVPAEEPGGRGDLAPAPRGERSAYEGSRRREAEQELHRAVAGDGNPSASAFRQTIFLPGGPKNGGGVRWVWRQFLVKKVSIFHEFL